MLILSLAEMLAIVVMERFLPMETTDVVEEED